MSETSKTARMLDPKPVDHLVPMHMELTRNQLLWLVNQELERNQKVLIPESVEITVEIPSGGDWSGMSMDLTEDRPIKFNWRT